MFWMLRQHVARGYVQSYKINSVIFLRKTVSVKDGAIFAGISYSKLLFYNKKKSREYCFLLLS